MGASSQPPRAVLPQAARRPSAAKAAGGQGLVDHAGYARFARGVRELIGLDLDQYRPAQMWRRVNAFALSHGTRSPDHLLAACRTDGLLLAALRAMLTINVSEFFRDPGAWTRLGQHLSGVVAAGGPLRAWSAGCSMGMEPYSLAMLVDELPGASPPRILATDIDVDVLATARAARYTHAQVAGLSATRRSRFMVEDHGACVVRPEIRATVSFRGQDLLADVRIRQQFDLVLCRNVVIYLTEPARIPLQRRLAGALRPSGLLFVGSSESILQPARFGLEPAGPSLYVRTAEPLPEPDPPA